MPEKKAVEVVEMFSFVQRLVHWTHTLAFLVLVVTGAILYIPPLRNLSVGNAGWVARASHRYGAIFLAIVILIYVIFDAKRLFRSMKLIFTWGAGDLEWLKAVPAVYFRGEVKRLPPQDRFNTGQKAFYLCVVLSFLALGVSGVLMWVGKSYVSPVLFRWGVLVHDAAAIAVTVFFLVHLYLAMMHPLMKDGMQAIRFGYISLDEVKILHAKWYKHLARGDD
jgi:formate dehydrogenase subunit gamma